MARTGRPKTVLTLTDEEREQLVRWSRRAKSSQALELRSKIVLACAKGTDNRRLSRRTAHSRSRHRLSRHLIDVITDRWRAYSCAFSGSTASPTKIVPVPSGTSRVPNHVLRSQRRCRAIIRIGSLPPASVVGSIVVITQRSHTIVVRNLRFPIRTTM